MIINQDSSDAQYQIKSYRTNQITVNDVSYDRSLIITADKLITDWQPQSLTDVRPEHWLPVIQLNPEIILFGTGQHFQMPHPSLLADLYQHKLKVESMDTGAACRTYMALVAEGRRVLAALLIK